MIQYPEMRRELAKHLRVLADPEYQDRVWVRREMPPGVSYDDFDLVVHFFFDDTCLGDDPQRAIGVFLETDAEAQLVGAVAKAIDVLFDRYGLELTDGEYISRPEWKAVVESAELASAVIRCEEWSPGLPCKTMRQQPGTVYHDVERLAMLLAADGLEAWSQRVEDAMLGGATSNEIIAALRYVLKELRKAYAVPSSRTKAELDLILLELASIR